ncbi:MAG: SDR family oxidoreductase [Bacteroidota bacterium]
MKFDLSTKTAIVTGGGSGIGRAISKALAGQGAQVHIFDLEAERARGTVDEIERIGGKGQEHSINVAKQSEVREAVARIARDNDLHILVNNAGIAHIGDVENTYEADMDRIYAVNIKGVYNCIHCAIPHMKENGGVILNMASIASSVGINDRFAYSASKGAVLTMTYSVAKDYLEYKVRCNSISPGRVHTPFVDGYLKANFPGKEAEMFDKLSKTQPIGRMAQPREVADLVVYLCSDEASFITGTDFPIDGGFIKLNGD